MKPFTKKNRNNPRRTTATIRDVALRANVAVGTVSRVVNNRTDVNEELRSRVLRAAEDLSYRPNARGRSLARNSSTLLSFMIFSVLPTLLEIALVTGFLIYKFDVWFGVITVGALLVYILLTFSISEWRTDKVPRSSSRAQDLLT